MPMTPLTRDLGQADLAVLERHADPRALLAAGPAELIRLITSTSGHQQGRNAPRSGGPPRRPPSSYMAIIRPWLLRN